MSFREERHALVAAVRNLFEAGVMSHSGHANVSVRVGQEQMLLTSSGGVRDLPPDQLAVVGFDGTVTEGRLEPVTTEIVSMHTAVYRARREAGAVIHTHSPYVTGFALANAALPCRYEALLRFGQTDQIPVVAWAPRGSRESVDAISEAVHTHPNTFAVLLGNHGLLAFAADAATTSSLVVAIEEAAEAEVHAVPLGGARDFPAIAWKEVRASMARARG